MTPKLSVRPKSNLWLLLYIFIIFCFLTPQVCTELLANTPEKAHSVERIAQFLAEAPTIGDVALSPDGSWVVYSVNRGNVATNTTTIEWHLQHLDNGGPLSESILLPPTATAVKWRPGGKELSMIVDVDEERHASKTKFALYDVNSRRLEYLSLSKTEQNPNSDLPALTVGADYVWSPGGDLVAFTSTWSMETSLDQRQGIPFSEWNSTIQIRSGKPKLKYGIFILNIKTGSTSPLTTSKEVHISAPGGFAWSPDARAIVLTHDNEQNSYGVNTDLIVVDRMSGKVRKLVTRAGKDESPNWSPDGRWVAFFTHEGEPSYHMGRPAVVSARGGVVVTFGQKGVPRTWPEGRIWWAKNSSSFLYQAMLEMRLQMVRADLNGETVEIIPYTSGDLTLPADRNHDITTDGRHMIFDRSSIMAPPELFLVDLDANGHPNRSPRQLTSLSPNFPLRDMAQTEIISWPSRDGKFTIHGVLLTPASEWSDGKLKKSMPTALYIPGGPSMVRHSFWGKGYPPALIAQGYAVLIPNTRGRGGYGDALYNGIRDSKSSMRLPYEDAMAGLDQLIENGVADADRMGVLGHSYGGGLTAYAVTRTNRFMAAIVYEGNTNLIKHAIPSTPGEKGWSILVRDLMGVHDLADPAERARLYLESPVFNADYVETPTLLQYGAKSAAGSHGVQFLNVLRHNKVPSAMFVYDEGHVFNRPAAVADNLTRAMEWLDYWVRGIKYSATERAVEYENGGRRTESLVRQDR